MVTPLYDIRQYSQGHHEDPKLYCKTIRQVRENADKGPISKLATKLDAVNETESSPPFLHPVPMATLSEA